MKKLPRRRIAVNVPGALGYVLTLLIWVLLASVIFASVIDSGVVIVPTEPIEPGAMQASANPSIFAVIVGYGITAVVVVATLIAVILMPFLVGKWLSRGVRWTFARLKITLTARSLLLAKSGLLLVPTIGMSAVSMFVLPAGETIPAVLLFGAVLTVVAVALFLVQLLLASRLRVAVKDVW